MGFTILSADNPLPEAGASSATLGHRAGSSRCHSVIIGISGGHVTLDDVPLPWDERQGRDEDRQESQTEIQGRIHPISLFPGGV